jgi:type IX secretion system PorP/SprF family membrane protein
MCLITFVLKAQDIHFTQYMASPLSLNPAETGHFDGNWRFANNYRNQWSSIGIPYKTISVGIDKPFRVKSGAVGLGVYFVNDKSGSAFLNENKLMLSCTYHIKIGGNHNLGIGIQGGYVVKNFQSNDLTFPSQFNETSGLFDNSLDNYIMQIDESINYPDLNLGLVYSNWSSSIKPVIGFAIFHVNNPKKSFLREDDKLPPRIVAHGNLSYNISQSIYLKPHALFMIHKGAKDIVGGLEAGYLFPEKSLVDIIYLGVQSRTAFSTFDAVSPVLGIGLFNFEIAVSYDVNISQLRSVSNMKGAFEISLIYKDFYKVLETITLPCDRY